VIINRLRQLNSINLPGEKAHSYMWPKNTNIVLPSYNTPPVDSAVLILIYPNINNELSIVFIKRSEDNGLHSGQIAFPGGKCEKYDKNYVETALREANEEVGFYSDKIEILGELSKLFISVSNYMVNPVLAYVPYTPIFYPNYNEVVEILEIPISHFLDTKNMSSFYFKAVNREFEAPCFIYKNYNIWGATAMIVSELREILSMK